MTAKIVNVEQTGVLKSLDEEVVELLKSGLTAEQISEQVKLDLEVVQKSIDTVKAKKLA